MNKLDKAKRFIQVWQKSASVAEVAKELGVNEEAVRSRVATYRKRGIPLKRMPRGGNLDWESLKEYAKGLRGKKG